MFPEALVAVLKNHPKVNKVYMNADGQWLFNASEDFPKQFSREEIMGSESTVDLSPESAETGSVRFNGGKNKKR